MNTLRRKSGRYPSRDGLGNAAHITVISSNLIRQPTLPDSSEQLPLRAQSQGGTTVSPQIAHREAS